MKKTVFIALKGSPAVVFIRRTMCGGRLKPGAVCLASKDELESWRKDVEIIEINALETKNDQQVQKLSLPTSPIPPKEILDCASALAAWIDKNNIKDWQLYGLTSVPHEP